MVVRRAEGESERRRALKRQLAAEAEARWGAERLRDLAESLDATARILAHLGSIDFAHDDAEPDFIG